MKKALFNWSGGKDSSICLHKVLQSGDFEIAALLTTVSDKYQRISQHGVRVELLEQQASSIGIELQKLMMPDWPTMEAYNEMMEKALMQFKDQGVTTSIFGDIFLEDLRKYREERLAMVGLEGEFPLWKTPTNELAEEFIDLGFKAVVVCVDEKHLPKEFAGREFDNAFLEDLPEGVDPCGEYGEFHSFVYAGPIFKEPIAIEKGEIVYRKYEPAKSKTDQSYDCGPDEHPTTGFWYCDLLPYE